MDDGTERIMQLSGSSFKIAQSEANGYTYNKAFTPLAHRNRSFIYENSIYTLQGNQLYKSQTLSNTPAALSWSAHQTIPQIDSSDWQITQYRNRIFFFEEGSKTIYRYHPDDYSLESKGVIQSTISSGAFAVTSSAYYFVSNGSVTQLAVLTSPEQNLSVEVYSAANSNTDSVPIQIMSLDPSGRFFGRRLQGTADFDDQTVSGGPGDLGIEDRSLAAADLVNRSITSEKIVDQTFQRRHFPTYELTIDKIEDDSLDAELFQTAVIYSSKIKNGELDTRHLGLSSFENEKLKDLGFQNEDFADNSIKNEHIILNTIDGAHIKDDTIVAANIESLTLLKEDFAELSIESKQFKDGSIQDIDIKTETLTERHFQTNSVTEQEIKKQAVTTDKISNFTITTEKFKNYTIETIDIADDSISGELMLSEALDSDHFVDDVGGIQTVHFSDGAITWEKIADDAIDGSKIAADTVTSSDIATKTITDRELNTGSITGDEVDDNTLTDHLLATNAIKADKLATDAISEEDIANATMIDRHFFSGGQGGILSYTINMSAISFNDRVRPAIAIHEDYLYVLGGGVSGGFKINLATKATETVTALTNFPSNSFESTYASNESTLYLLDNSKLYGFNFNSETVYEITSDPFTGSSDTKKSAFLFGGSFYVAGGAGDHSQKLHRHNLNGGAWTALTDIDAMSAPAVVQDSTSVYLFYNGGYRQSSNIASGWSSKVNLSFL